MLTLLTLWNNVNAVNNVVGEYIMSRKLLILALTLTLVAAATLHGLSLAEDPKPTEPAEPTQFVGVANPERAAGFKQSQTFTGIVQTTRSTRLSFNRSGRLQSVLVEEGSLVHAGQVLAVLDTRALVAGKARLTAQLSGARARLEELRNGPRREPRMGAQAQVERYRSELQLAEAKLERRRTLFEQGVISKESLDEFESQVRVARLALESASQSSLELEHGTRPEVLEQQAAEIRQLEAALQALQVEFEDSELRAPYSGEIAARSLDEGAIVNPGVEVLVLDEVSSREAVIDLPTDLQAPGKATLRVGGQSVQAKLLPSSSRRDSKSATYAARYSLPAGKAGEAVILTVDSRLDVGGYWLPSDALTAAGNGLWQCYTLGPGSVVEVQKLEVLHREADRVLVRGTLTESDLVLVEGAHSVVAGQRVALLDKSI